MLVSDLVNRLGDMIDFIALFVPPDVRIASMRVDDGKGRFELAFDMGQNIPLAQKYQEVLATKLTENNVDFRYYETGRRLTNRSPVGQRPLDNMSSYVFETPTYVVKLVNFSNYAQKMSQTPAGEGEDMESNNIEEEGASDE